MKLSELILSWVDDWRGKRSLSRAELRQMASGKGYAFIKTKATGRQILLESGVEPKRG